MRKVLFSLLIMLMMACQNKVQNTTDTSKSNNEIEFAKGLSIQNFEDFTIVSVSNLWPESTLTFKYITHKKGVQIPDSLQHLTAIEIPVQTSVVTSTTHIPGLTLLDVSESLVGFPNLDYISSLKVRAQIEAGSVREVGSNLSLNTEVLLDLSPDVMIAFGVDGQRESHVLLQKAGIPIVYNGDWMEQNPLGRAEWIKLFGVLYDKQTEANALFNQIKNDYQEAKKLSQIVSNKPTVMAGSIYEETWYLPQGESWAAQFLKDANADYLWQSSTGNGSLSLSFETVLEQAQNADFWIGPGQFTSYQAMLDSNPNYAYFKAFQDRKVYSFSSKKGKTGGVIYYEEASSRPDLVLKDLIKILHPNLLPDYELYFFEPLD
uniref:ABC transporter substrate-binding protein n=1 Tax=Flavobacterium sp. TaxID=239 RepID=UPI00404B8A10